MPKTQHTLTNFISDCKKLQYTLVNMQARRSIFQIGGAPIRPESAKLWGSGGAAPGNIFRAPPFVLLATPFCDLLKGTWRQSCKSTDPNTCIFYKNYEFGPVLNARLIAALNYQICNTTSSLELPYITEVLYE